MVYPLAMLLMGAGVARKAKNDELDDQDRLDERAAKQEDRVYQRGERTFQQSERARMLANRDRVAAAAAPVAPVDGTVYQPENDDDGNPMPANPTAGTLKVGDQRFSDPAAAAAAAEAANTPAATTQRISKAMMTGGDWQGAQAVRTGARQEQAADMQISEAMRKAANEKFNDSLSEITSFDGLAEAVGAMAGGLKLQAQPSADGKKVTLVQVKPDGTTVATPKTFDNTPTGLAEARLSLAKGVSPHEQVTYLHQREQAAQAAAQLAETTRHNQASEGLQAQHIRATMASKVPAAATAATPDSTFDGKTAADIAKTLVEKEAAASAEGGKPWTGAQVAKRKDEIVETMRQTHTVRFVESAVQRSLQQAQADPAAYAEAYGKAVQLGMPPAKLAQLGFKPPAGQQAPAAAAPVAAAPAGVQPAAAPRQMASMSSAAPATVGPSEQAGLAFEQARAARTAAQQQMQAFGLRQKATDPAGYAKAEAAYRVAVAAENEARAKYEQLAQAGGQPRVAYAQP